METTSGAELPAVRCTEGLACPLGESVVRTGALRRVKDTIASGKRPKIRMTATAPHTTVRVHPPVRAGKATVLSLGFMNITMTTYR
jgi:hypothetical protein